VTSKDKKKENSDRLERGLEKRTRSWPQNGGQTLISSYFQLGKIRKGRHETRNERRGPKKKKRAVKSDAVLVDITGSLRGGEGEVIQHQRLSTTFIPCQKTEKKGP